MDNGYDCLRWQSDLVNTKESVFPVCDKPYHTKKRNVQKGEDITFCGKVHWHDAKATISTAFDTPDILHNSYGYYIFYISINDLHTIYVQANK